MTTEEGYKRMKELMTSLGDRLGVLEDSVLSCCGVTLAQCQALIEIGRAGRLSLGELAARLGLDNSTLSRTVNNLATKGLCEREDDPQDRRYVSIRLAETGAEIYKAVDSGMDGWYRAVYEAVPAKKRLQVLESMEVMLEAVTKAGIRNGSDCCGG